MKFTGYIEKDSELTGNQYYIYGYPENLDGLLKKQSKIGRRNTLIIFALSLQLMWLSREVLKLKKGEKESEKRK